MRRSQWRDGRALHGPGTYTNLPESKVIIQTDDNFV
jgi:hypothetical protein